MLVVPRFLLMRACRTLAEASEHVRRKSGGVATLVVADGAAVLRVDSHHCRADYALGDAHGDFTAPIPLRRCIALLELCRGETVCLWPTKEGVAVETANGSFLLAVDRPDGDTLKEPLPPLTRVLPGVAFRAAIRKTVFATDTESTRYGLGGVRLDAEDGWLTLVATDSRRMTIAATDMPAVDVPVPTTVPAALLRLAMLDASGDVHLGLDSRCVALRSGSLTLLHLLFNERFPDWRRVLPTKFAATAQLPVDRLGDAIDRLLATLTPDELRKTCGLAFAFSPGLLSLLAFTVEGDTAEVEEARATAKVGLPVDYTGDPRVVRLDVRFVRDFLAACDSPTVALDLPPNEYAVMFRANGGYRYVLMPLGRK